MSSIKESSLGLNYGWSYGETGWNSGMDENIVLTGFHANKQVKGILSNPPTTNVSSGDAYIVGSSPTGTWVGNYAKIAIYDRGTWLFATPSTGVSVYNKANGCWYEYNNGWILKSEAEESPYIKVKDFDFSTGYTITDSRQLLLYPTNQTYYQWAGTFPKVVAAGATPATSGGIGAGAWVDRTDLTLRAEITPSVTEALRRSYADAGYNLVDGSFESGGTLTNTNDVLLHKASGIAYSWGGTLPITVAPNSTPTPIGSDGWIDLSAVTLRSDVAAIDTRVTAIDTRVTALATIKSTCLVNAVGTGAPHETVSAALPANIAIDTRYVLANPFGANVPVTGWAEVFFNGKWSQTGFVFSSSSIGGYGVSFNFVQGEGIVIQTGNNALFAPISSQSGGGHGIAGASTASAPCRVFIQKLGA